MTYVELGAMEEKHDAIRTLLFSTTRYDAVKPIVIMSVLLPEVVLIIKCSRHVYMPTLEAVPAGRLISENIRKARNVQELETMSGFVSVVICVIQVEYQLIEGVSLKHRSPKLVAIQSEDVCGG
jgi:hypothetical protein